MMYSVPDVNSLKRIPEEHRKQGAPVWVGGYYKEGDPGAKLMRWDEECSAPDNGGTVHAPEDGGKGRWIMVHQGVGNYRCFGVFGSEHAADEALEAWLADPTVYRIEASSDLRFVKRHRLDRSHIELDFNGFAVYTDGIEDAPPNDPFSAVFQFRGKAAGVEQTVILTEDAAEMSEVFEVGDSSAFAIGEWWTAQVSKVEGGGVTERELDKLIMVTEIVDARHVRFNYKNGWRIETGRSISYRKITPVVRAHVKNMVFHGAGNTDITGSHPLVYEYAVDCNAIAIEAFRTFWPVVMRRHCTHFVTERCRLTNPTEVVIGGTGYMTQQIYCLYGHVRDCQTSNARHLNDFTGSAYCQVENCHGDGDEHGTFVTHGQYEHDLAFTGNSGLLSFGNSGPIWGESAKRITVKKHVGSRFISFRKVTDITVEDVHIFEQEGIPDSGSIWVNADGVQMKNCSAEKTVAFFQAASRSERPNVVENCLFKLAKGRSLNREQVIRDIAFYNCDFLGLDGNDWNAPGSLYFRDCRLHGAADAAPLRMEGRGFSFQGGEMKNTGILLCGSGDQRVEIRSGARISGTNHAKSFFATEKECGRAEWRLSDMVSQAADAETAHFSLTSGYGEFTASGSTFEGGKYAVSGDYFGGGYMLHHGNVERTVDRSGLPQESASVRHEQGNLILREKPVRCE
ncbi:peptidase C14 [Paenibacillus sp. HJL G12]|uniref:Peptidase C14 n=1 Tax=Paenibacillus dendrobii TaxID=2691084 RepID=A0A7X3IN54_9BACL|nr:peptidase C14 [Paenibacillus dendrobii]MWV46989.1 peptidase C14 [Paenibacillus dendrobii]